jgi:hypothetical protein
MSDSFDCFGIHPGVPKLDYFKGGFILAGAYKPVPVREEACLDLPTNGIDFMALQFAPEILRSKVDQLDSFYDFIESRNPAFASYIMKPTAIFEAYKTGGMTGLMDALNERKERFMQGIPDSKT